MVFLWFSNDHMGRLSSYDPLWRPGHLLESWNMMSPKTMGKMVVSWDFIVIDRGCDGDYPLVNYHNYDSIHHFLNGENPLFLWPCSIAM